MARRKKIKPKVGDVFSFPINEKTNCFGQIVSEESKAVLAKLYILFDFVSDSIPDLSSIVNKPILAIAHLDDGSIEDGEWTIVGNIEPALKNIKFPNYLTGIEPYVIDHEEEILRLATEQDMLELDYPISHSSNTFYGLAKAKYDAIEEWEENYGDLLFDPKKWVRSDEEALEPKEPIETDGYSEKVSDESDNDVSGEDEEDFVHITIHYHLNTPGFGTPDDLKRRYKIEDIMDKCLRETGNGDCDCGEIGNGQMFIYCRVRDPEKAVETIKEELKNHHLLDGANITY